MILINQLTAEMTAGLTIVKDAATRLELELDKELDIKILLQEMEAVDKKLDKLTGAVNKLLETHDK